MIIFRPPTAEDVAHVAERMRAADVLECRLLGRHGPKEALVNGIAHSLWAFAAEVDGETQCIFGVASEGLLSEEGSPWLLGVDGIERHARELIAGTKAYLARMQLEFETLSNYVHANNRNAIRYLRWCGFSFGEPVEVDGEAFLPFEMKRAA